MELIEVKYVHIKAEYVLRRKKGGIQIFLLRSNFPDEEIFSAF